MASIRQRIGHDPLMVVGVNAVIFDENRHVLLQRRTDDATWGLPGGILELEESLVDALKRETKEETGLDIDVLRLTGLYSQQQIHTYPNGDQVNFVTAVFVCHVTGGIMKNLDGESTAVGFFDTNHLPDPLPKKYIQRIQDAKILEGVRVV